MISRRAFVATSAAAILAAPSATQAQRPDKVYRIGYLRQGQPPKPFVEAFQQGLRERGYVDGQNVVIEFRFTDGGVDQLPRLAEELVRLKVDVIVASGPLAVLAAKKATTSVPIVFPNVLDPVELGLVSSLARPGGNITGLAFASADLIGKRPELLREVVPKLRRVAVLWDPANPSNPRQLQGAEIAARTLGMQLFEPVPFRGPNDFDSAFQALRGADGLLQLGSSFFVTQRVRLVELAVRSRLPAVYVIREYVELGGLMSYGPHAPDLYRRAATYVDKILRGAKPADLPIEQPTKFELILNLKAAKALGLTVPPALLLRADQVLE